MSVALRRSLSVLIYGYTCTLGYSDRCKRFKRSKGRSRSNKRGAWTALLRSLYTPDSTVTSPFHFLLSHRSVPNRFSQFPKMWKQQGDVSMNLEISKSAEMPGMSPSACALYSIRAELMSNGSCRRAPHSRPPSTRADSLTVEIVKGPIRGLRVDEPSLVFNHALLPHIGRGVRRP